MSLKRLTQTFPWIRYSRKLIAKIEKPRSAGIFSVEESEARLMFLSIGIAGSKEDCNYLELYWLVDKEDGIIVDAKFQAFGHSSLIGAAELLCEFVVGKNYDQIKRMNAAVLDQQVRDKVDISAFPLETAPYLNTAVLAAYAASENCKGLPLPMQYETPSMPLDLDEIREGGYPGWEDFSKVQKLEVIEAILEQDIRPFIAMDAGGVKVIDLVEGVEVIIKYEGSCTSCHSSVGTTLAYIQQIFRAKAHSSIIVTPDFMQK